MQDAILGLRMHWLVIKEQEEEEEKMRAGRDKKFVLGHPWKMPKEHNWTHPSLSFSDSPNANNNCSPPTQTSRSISSVINLHPSEVYTCFMQTSGQRDAR
mmetsp:Transcript_1514/g.3270  ORF Transcript_1514/g.3270 Transcript_1514/m.3270 type:complete len:100 (-) Transcript_1514:55-354(-)